jgi:hypothetical protein
MIATCCGVALTAAVAACARQGDTPAGTPTVVTSVEIGMSAVPAPAGPLSLAPLPPGTAKHGCAEPGPAIKKPPGTRSPERSRGAGPNDAGDPRPTPRAMDRPAATPLPGTTGDAAERARKALEAQQSPVPRRGIVPPAAVPGAEACVRLLQLEFNLLAAAAGGTPADAAVRAALLKAGLRDPVVEPGPAFAASTGSACVVGAFTGTEPSMAITPLGRGGACTP